MSLPIRWETAVRLLRVCALCTSVPVRMFSSDLSCVYTCTHTHSRVHAHTHTHTHTHTASNRFMLKLLEYLQNTKGMRSNQVMYSTYLTGLAHWALMI